MEGYRLHLVIFPLIFSKGTSRPSVLAIIEIYFRKEETNSSYYN